LNLSDTVAQTVNLTLLDSEGTGLIVTSTQDVLFDHGVATQKATNTINNQSRDLLDPRAILPYLEQFMEYRFNSFDPIGPIYFYHPITPIDLSALDELSLEEGFYKFIDRELDITEYERFYWYMPYWELQELKKGPKNNSL
jgi:hypothetical protein